MHSKTAEELMEARAFFHEGGLSQNYLSRMTVWLDREKDWVLFYRLGVLNRNHNTNNFAEATIRILKDIILGRQTAFNTVAFVEFCLSVLEPYIVKCLECCTQS